MEQILDRVFGRQNLPFDAAGPPRYEQLARFIELAISDGRLSPGERLPTVRQLASGLGVSATTITSAFDLLAERRLIRPEVGRGTFVSNRPLEAQVDPVVRFPRFPGASLDSRKRVPWRRRALMTAGARLRAGYPGSIDCSTGRPDPSLFPLDVIRCAWETSLQAVTTADLQYAGPEPIPSLAARLTSLLQADLVPARAQDLIMGSSAQQFLVLALDIVVGLWGDDGAVVAVEEPGYATVFDTYERAGAKLIGVEVDEFGAVPASLDAVLRKGAKAALFTPRGHNPTGASWSSERTAALATVLAGHRDVIAIEDDQFAGVATNRPGSLMSDGRLEDRTIYIRSFSKSLGPDLRIAVALVRPRLRELLAEAKRFADGWTSRLVQRMLTQALNDERLFEELARARDLYRERRQFSADAVNEVLLPHGGGTRCGPDGMNLWVHLPPGVDAKDAVERCAAAGVCVADGEPFFLAPGRSDVVRFNPCAVAVEQAVKAGRTLAEASLACSWGQAGPIHV